MHRIFAPNLDGEIIPLDAENIHYLKKALRLQNGNEVIAFDGRQEILGTIQNNAIKKIKTIRTHEPKKLIKLAVSEIEANRFEWMVQKCTELGVDEIFPFISEHTQRKIKYNRLPKIAIEAAKQCQRISIPTIHKTQTLENFLKTIDNTWNFGHINTSITKKIEHTNVIIGPEGGFSASEEKLLIQQCTPICINNNTLRTETAAICTVSLISYKFL